MNDDPTSHETHLQHFLDASVQSAGCKIELQTPSGSICMTLPPGLSEGQTLRLPGRGELQPDGTRGDVLLTFHFFHVDTPATSALPSARVEPPAVATIVQPSLPAEVSETERPSSPAPLPPSPPPLPNQPPTSNPQKASPSPGPLQRAASPPSAPHGKPPNPKPPTATPTPAPAASKPADAAKPSSYNPLVALGVIALFCVPWVLLDWFSSNPDKDAAKKNAKHLEPAATKYRPTAYNPQEDFKARMAAKMRDSNQAIIADLAWIEEKKKLMASDPDPKPRAESTDKIIREMRGDTSDIGDPKDWVPAGRLTDHASLLSPGGSSGRFKLKTIQDHINISMRMGVDAESLSKLTSEQSRQRFCQTLHCVFFERPWPPEVTQRLDDETFRKLRTEGTLSAFGTLVVKVRCSSGFKQFNLEITAADIKEMEHTQYMKTMQQWERSAADQIPASALSRATIAFEKQWLTQRKDRGLRYQDMSWWYERLPLLYTLQSEHNISTMSEFKQRPKQTLDKEILSLLASKASPASVLSDRFLPNGPQFRIEEVSVRKPE